MKPKQKAANQLSEKVEMPTPFQLAKLAVGFLSKDSPLGFDAALEKALELYLISVVFHRKHYKKTLSELMEEFGDISMVMNFSSEKTFQLSTEKRRDEARDFLANHGLKLKYARSVLESIKAMVRLNDMEKFLKDVWKTSDLYQPNEFSLTEKEAAIKKAAISHGWDEPKWETKWKMLLNKFQTSAGVYSFTESWLISLIEWKKARKVSGGNKSIHSGKAKQKIP